jgi:hypothetical protein
VVENIVRGVEFPLNPPCKRRTERTCRRTTKGLEQKGQIGIKTPKTDKWNSKLQGVINLP